MMRRLFLFKVLLVFLSLSLLSIEVEAQVSKRIYFADDEIVPDAHPMDFTHLKLDVSFEPKEAKVIGHVWHQFKVLPTAVDTLFIHGENIEISTSKLDGAEVKFRKVKGGFVFDFASDLTGGSEHELEIEYTAKPKKGIYFIGWNDATDRSRKQIWTQGQGRDNRHWIPMYDLPNDKVISELIVHMPSEYRVLSNGYLKSSKKDKNGNTTWHYYMKNPHASYLIMLGIGEYEVKTTQSASKVPMHFYYYPDWVDRVEPTYKFSEDMMRFMEEETGVAYPWGSYAQIPVQDFLYGAMENTSATIFGDFYMVDERSYLDKNYVRVNAHELAHQWFGDYVTARTSTHHWLQESFATHYDLTYQGIAFGQDHFDWARRKATLAALAASKQDLKPLAHSHAGTARHYPKGSYVLQMLRDVAGNENYKKAIKYYLNKHAFGNVDSEDLLVAFHEATGLSLDWFWEEWIYKGGEPHYEVSHEVLRKRTSRLVRFEVKQVHDLNDLTSVFKMPIVFSVLLSNGDTIRKKVMVDKIHQKVDIEIPTDPDVEYVLFDEGSRVMKSVTFEKPYRMLVAQAMKAPKLLDRHDAILALRSFPVDQKRNDLNAIYKEEKFHGTKSAIIRQLINDPNSRELIRSALYDKDVEVRRTVVNHTKVIHPGLRAEFEKLLTDPSYRIVERAMSLLINQYPEEIDKYLDMTKDVMGNDTRNIRLKWLELSYHHKGGEENLKEIIDYTSNSFEFRTRVQAAQTLQTLNYLDETFLNHMLDGVFSGNPRLRTPMKEVIRYFAKQAKHRDLIEKVIEKGSWDSFQKRRIASIGI